MSERVATFAVERAEDVFELRQGGRVAAAAVGCDKADQVRFATALSELARESLAQGAGTTVTLAVCADGALLVDFDKFPHTGRSTGGVASGLDAARKLVSEVTFTVDFTTATAAVRLRHRPATADGTVRAATVRAALARTAAGGLLNEAPVSSCVSNWTIAQRSTRIACFLSTCCAICSRTR